MKTKWCLLIVILMMLVWVVGCSAPAAQPTVTPVPPVVAPPTAMPPTVSPTEDLAAATVTAMVERLNAGDSDSSLAYFADDALTYFVGMPPTGMEIYHGREELRPVWEECVGSHFKLEMEVTGVSDGIVYANTKTWHDFTRELGVAPNSFRDVYQVKDGKIVAYVSTLTEESLAKFKPALAEIMPPEPIAAQPVGDPATEMTVAFAGGTCAYDGPMLLQAGTMTVTLDVQDQGAYALTFFTLDADKDFVDLMAATVQPAPPSWSKMFSIKETNPGESRTYNFPVAEGPVYAVCWSKPLETPIGNIGPFMVIE